MPPTPITRPRIGFPISVITLFVAAGLLVDWILVYFLIWIQTVGSQRGWWDLPQDDEPRAALALACVAVLPAAGLIWLGARRCRDWFDYSRLATGLIATACVVATVVLIGSYQL